MDRNSIIGIVLIGVILIGYSIFTKPAREAQMEAIKRNDSIAKVEQARQQELQREQTQNLSSLPVEESDDKITDEQQENFGVFSNALEGDEQIITLENELIKLDFSTLGGRPYSATLKEYSTHDSLPVVLFDGDSSKFDLQFFADNRRISTNELYFVTQSAKSEYVVTDQAKSIVMRLDISDESYIEYTYSLRPHEYMIDFDIRFVGLDELRADNMVYQYEIFFPSTEKGFQNENNYTTLYYRYKEGDIEKFRLRSKKSIEEESALTQLEWVAYKHQFFSTVMIAKDYFESAYMMNERYDEPGKYVRHFYSEIDLPYDRTSADQKMSMAFYFGPNHHQTLKEYDQWKLENLVTVGGSVIRWLNEFVIIKIFNWLNNYIANYGIIILLLTLILKTALFPLTYKSYKSQAVMRVLKPQVEEINAKFPKKEDAMKKQQATMDLYRKAGANPLGGCLPMLLQMPILYAMFRFFPSSIELRGESFLWADDLSTYDSILDLPFNIPMYGDHVSLFTILMTVTTVLSMRINNQTQSSSAMPGMKTMMYIMPLFMLFFFNNYASALSYYYFVSLLITILQTWVFRQMIDDKAIRAQININKKKPAKKSKFQQRMEDMAKKQQKQRKR